MALNSMGLGFEFVAKDRATSTMRRVRQEMGKTSNQAQELERRQRKAAQGARRGAAMMAAGVGTFALVNKAAKAYGNFELVISSAAGKMVDGTENLKALNDAALKAGQLTQFDPEEAAQALAELGAQGLNAKESIKALRPVLDLAAASLGQLGVADAATVGMAALNAFGKTVDDLPSVVDKLTMVSDRSAFQMRDFQVAISQAAAQAKAGGQSFDSMLSMLGLLRDAGNEASSAATAYREAMRRVAGDKGALKMMKKLRVSSVDGNKQMKDLGTIIAELHPKLQELGVQERNLALVKIFGVRGMKTYNALIASYEKQLKKGVATVGQYTKGHELLLDQIGNSSGKAAQKVEENQKTLGMQYKLLAGSWKTTVIQFGSVFAQHMLPVLKALTSLLNDVVKWIKDLTPVQKKALSMAVLLGAALITVVGALKLMSGLMSMMTLGKLAGQYAAGQAAMATSTTATTAAVTAQNVAMATTTTRVGRAMGAMRTFGSTIANNTGLLTMAAAAAIGFGLAISDAIIEKVARATEKVQTAAHALLNYRLSFRKFSRTVRRGTDYMGTFNVKLREQTQALIKAASVSASSAEKVTSKITSTIGRLSIQRQQSMIKLMKAWASRDIKGTTEQLKKIHEYEAKMSALNEAQVHIQAKQYRRSIGRVKDKATFESRMRTILLSDVIKQQKIETDFAAKRKALEAGIAKIGDPVKRKNEQEKANKLWAKQRSVVEAGRKKIAGFAQRGGMVSKGASPADAWRNTVGIAAGAQKGAGLTGQYSNIRLKYLNAAWNRQGIKGATPEQIKLLGELNQASWQSTGRSKKQASGYRASYEASLKSGTAPGYRAPQISARGSDADIKEWVYKYSFGLLGSQETSIADAIRSAYQAAGVDLNITINPGDKEATVDAKNTARGGGRFRPTVRTTGSK